MSVRRALIATGRFHAPMLTLTLTSIEQLTLHGESWTTKEKECNWKCESWKRKQKNHTPKRGQWVFALTIAKGGPNWLLVQADIEQKWTVLREIDSASKREGYNWAITDKVAKGSKRYRIRSRVRRKETKWQKKKKENEKDLWRHILIFFITPVHRFYSLCCPLFSVPPLKSFFLCSSPNIFLSLSLHPHIFFSLSVP